MVEAHRWTGRRIRTLALMAGSCAAIAAGPVLAADAQPGRQPAAHTQSFDETDFAIVPIPGRVSMDARAGWVWRQGDTHRILLQDEVDVVIADHRFRAGWANIWLRKAGQSDDGDPLYQIYTIFENVRSGDGTISMTAERLPVRGVVEVSEPVNLALTARFDAPPRERSEAGRMLARTNAVFAQRVLGADEPMPVTADQPPRPWTAEDPTPIADARRQAADPELGAEPTGARGPIFEPEGVFSIAIGGRVVVDGATSEKGSVITADGGVTLQYQAPGTDQWIDFRAQRVVVYTTPGEQITGVDRLGTEQIEGIYLEGGVFAGDDQWSVRSPRMYLDVRNNRALMLDTVFWTTDRRTAMPLYVRAEEVRQVARREFTASKARISNTAFFEPDITIGINDIKVTVEETGDDESIEQLNTNPDVTVEASSVTLRAGPVPLLWLPGFKGDPSDVPLRQISIGDSNREGVSIRTSWNALALLKVDAPPGVDLEVDFDYYGERGFATGLSGHWLTGAHRGGLFSYLLFDDSGEDVLASGRAIDRDGETRGILRLWDIWDFTNKWTMITEVNAVSDAGLVPALFEDLARESEAFRNRLQLERRSEDNYFAFEFSTTLDDFIVPEHQLQTPGYSVQKLPETRFIAMTRDLLPDYDPGLLTYSFEARAGLLSLAFSEVDAREYGMVTDSLADEAFGTDADESLADFYRALGLDESTVHRYDTRHELTANLDLGPVRVTPFVVGRLTAYNSSFDDFSPDQDEHIRVWTGGGVTLSTTLQRVHDDVESRFFDLHRLRHIVEPSITVWRGSSNFDEDELPIFDDDVEGLLRGTAFRAAVDQTWQTKRGGVGRWRDVDLVQLRTEYVWTSDDTGRSPVPDFYSPRPELSNPGEYFGASMIVKPTEILAIAGEWVYDIEQERTAKSSVGTILNHHPNLMTSIEYREVRPLDATFATLGARYRLSDKYALSSFLSYNFRRNDFQSFNTQILRRFQVGTLGAVIRYNNIRSETSIGFVFRPLGSSGDLAIDPSWGG